nr:xylosyltransferase oxt [Halyomorpha halys]
MKMELLTVLLVLTTTARLIDGNFLGCYEDNAVRLLPDYGEDLGATNSPGRCVYRCMQVSSYKYAGVEAGTQCFCSYGKPYELMKRNQSECNSLCPGSIEYCGGPWRLSVYSIDFLNTKLLTNYTTEAVMGHPKASSVHEVPITTIQRKKKNVGEENAELRSLQERFLKNKV